MKSARHLSEKAWEKVFIPQAVCIQTVIRYIQMFVPFEVHNFGFHKEMYIGTCKQIRQANIIY